MTTNISGIKPAILKILDEKKAENIIEIDLSDNTQKLADSCIVASGTSSRHTQAVADYVYRYLKSEKMHPVIEGTAQSGWVMIEASGIEIHLFKPELREYYDLESLLTSGKTPNDIQLENS